MALKETDIDPKQLPDRILFDTGVFVRAFEQRNDPRTPDCKKVWDEVQKQKKSILIAAPTLAEILRSQPAGTPLPRLPGVVVVPFDSDAAILLGGALSMTTLRAVGKEAGTTLTPLKYDSMILACAARHNAAAVATLDPNMSRLAAALDLAAFDPVAFLTRQRTLPGTT